MDFSANNSQASFSLANFFSNTANVKSVTHIASLTSFGTEEAINSEGRAGNVADPRRREGKSLVVGKLPSNAWLRAIHSTDRAGGAEDAILSSAIGEGEAAQRSASNEGGRAASAREEPSSEGG